MEDEDSRTVFVGNINPEDTSEQTLYELFLQAGPLHYVKIPKDKATGRSKNFGFICYRHSVSVPYAIELLNDIDVYGRNLRVQSRNHEQRQVQGQARGPEGIHSLDPDFGKVQNFSGPSQPCGQQALMQTTPSLLGLPNHIMSTMAHQQMALINAFQPIPLAANPHLNAPRERYSDRYGSLSYGRNPYMRDNSSRNSPHQRDNYSNYRKHTQYHEDASSNHHSNRDFRDKSGRVGDTQRHHGHFDFNRLGPQQNRDHVQHSPHSNNHYNRHDDGHRSESRHDRHDIHKSSDRHHKSHHDSRNYR